ncbi:hypothetical protein [Pseudonocardia sp. GCM10023141]|uniref:hypothetical protein n=1 Tax=Pseudonocardia sp. GCM10023141 TaxID=3252653 RepID=UPI0036195318
MRWARAVVLGAALVAGTLALGGCQSSPAPAAGSSAVGSSAVGSTDSIGSIEATLDRIEHDLDSDTSR